MRGILIKLEGNYDFTIGENIDQPRGNLIFPAGTIYCPYKPRLKQLGTFSFERPQMCMATYLSDVENRGIIEAAIIFLFTEFSVL